MNVLAGVDEAGLGPILGPLVVAGVALSGPAGVCPWKALRSRVSRRKQIEGKVRVSDSKQVHQGPHGLAHLERTVLAFWGAWRGDVPATLSELLREMDVDEAPLRECPWYRDLDLPLPLRVPREVVEIQAAALARALARRELSVLHMGARPVEAQEFNDLIAGTDNKSRAHFHAYSGVIGELLRLLPDGTRLVADRCGGLVHYVPALRRAWPGAGIRVVAETPAESRYEIRGARKRVTVAFAVDGDDRSFPTALASCLAKYTRELMVHLLNRWFCSRLPGLRPTAGYFGDGRRFLDDIAPVLAAREFPPSLLIRCR